MTKARHNEMKMSRPSRRCRSIVVSRCRVSSSSICFFFGDLCLFCLWPMLWSFVCGSLMDGVVDVVVVVVSFFFFFFTFCCFGVWNSAGFSFFFLFFILKEEEEEEEEGSVESVVIDTLHGVVATIQLSSGNSRLVFEWPPPPPSEPETKTPFFFFSIFFFFLMTNCSRLNFLASVCIDWLVEVRLQRSRFRTRPKKTSSSPVDWLRLGAAIDRWPPD